MNQPRYSRDDLLEASHHVFYEVLMLDRVVSALAVQYRVRADSDDLPYWQFQTNVLLESLGIHTRCLMGFFWPPKDAEKRRKRSTAKQASTGVAVPMANDLFATDFLSGFGAPKLPKKVHDRVSTEIAHLTTLRKLDATEKQWFPTLIHGQLWPAISAFYREASRADVLCDEWKHFFNLRTPSEVEEDLDPNTPFATGIRPPQHGPAGPHERQ